MSDNLKNIASNNFKDISSYPIPTKRAAYSDRTAWLMAIMAELAYIKFDEDDQNAITELAQDLAHSRDPKAEIQLKLKKLLAEISKHPSAGNKHLDEILQMGGFKLQGVLFDIGTDTQGFIAVKEKDEDEEQPGMAIIVFRGTEKRSDWVTNLDCAMEQVISKNGKVIGKVHKGFYEGFKSVEPQIKALLKEYENLPLFITGHSLGGALATLATWYISGEKLAACYTFGAPRAGDYGLSTLYHTPIYRIVHGTDPVPCMPPSKMIIDFLRFIFLKISKAIPIFSCIVTFLNKRDGYIHYGDSRYLSICKPDSEENFPKLMVMSGVGNLERLWYGFVRNFGNEGAWSQGARIDKYHAMGTYRAKLRFWARKRNKEKN